MTKHPFIIFCCLVFWITLQAQIERDPDGGGSFSSYPLQDEITPQQNNAIIYELKKSVLNLTQKGILPLTYQPMITGFQWPIKQASGFNDNGYYGITNYVDEDNSAGILEYNCGNRTYNGHQGTDIATWPFPWQKMLLNAIQIIAAAPGTIIYKSDGNSDTSCAFCPSYCNWNAVYVMQTDGSVAWYGHMKTNSQTSKTVGQTVALGEFLGIVGSSGNSTAPHLHFQVYTDNTYTQLVDPWGGPCNGLNGTTSWWANQQPYYTPTLSKVMTHNPAPAMTGCKSGEAVNEKVNFVNGQTIYVGSYYRDQQIGQQSVHTVYRPDNTILLTWSQSFTSYYSLSWWYYIINLPNPAPTGMWRYQVVYNGTTTQSTYFGVNEIGYTFTGNGDWNISTNWSNNTIPPVLLPPGSEILINPVAGGECDMNGLQTISSGAKITVLSGKKLVDPGYLIIQ